LCLSSTEDEGMALRSRLPEAGFKPPKAAFVKSKGCEHFGKIRFNLAGMDQKDE